LAPPAELTALAADWRLQQQTVAARVTVIGRRLWRQVDGAAVLASFDGAVARPLLTALTAGQLAAADGAQDYVEAALEAQGVAPDPSGTVNGRALAGVASDGRSLDGLLRQPAQDTVGRMAVGVDVDQALASGLAQLERMLATQIADAGRGAVAVGMANDRKVRGYVRHLSPPSCARCIILAGKFYRHNQGFRRHPRCDCVHMPAAEVIDPQDPMDLFGQMDAAGLKKAGWSKADVAAINDGADIYAVTNARRGLRDVQVAGRQVQATTVGTSKRRPIRLTPDSIADIAGNDRAEQIRLLRAHGYIL
jgi:hypothetical protein